MLKKIIAVMVCFAMMIGFPVLFMSKSSAAGTMSGSGTAADPYIITTAAQLASISGQSYCYQIGNNIDISSYSTWAPIGTFHGTLDGNGYSITGLKDGSYNSYNGTVIWYGNVDCGLFNLTSNATIKNLTISGSIYNDEYYTGALISQASSTTVTNCYSTVTIYDGSDYVGGMIGYANKCTITNCGAEVAITTPQTGIGQYQGGFIGYDSGSTITGCYSTGCAGAASYAGGFAGELLSDNVSNCRSVGSSMGIEGSSYTGGFVGYSDGTITSCYSNCPVTVYDTGSGGLFGGFAGDNASIIDKCYSTGAVSVMLTDCYIGGFVGGNEGTISNSYSTGGASGDDGAGGLTGGFVASNSGTIYNCYEKGGAGISYESYGSVTGGFVADDVGGTIYNCYSASGAMSNEESNNNSDTSGGFVGIGNSSATIENCYTAGIGTTDNGYDAGGFGGRGSCVLSDCYWNSSMLSSGTYSWSGSNPIGLATTAMEAATFATTLNSNISSLSLINCAQWILVSGKNNNCPVLNGVGDGADITPPTGSYTLSKSTWTCGNVTITVTATDSGSGVKTVTAPDGTVTNGYIASYTVTSNGTYNFALTDYAGNSCTYPVTVSNIDHTVNVSQPTTVAYTIDPNAGTLTVPDITLVNNNQHVGVLVTLQSLSSSGIDDVSPTKYTNWNTLTAAQTASDLAIAVQVKETSPAAGGWTAISTASPQYAANVTAPVQLGFLNPGGTGHLTLSAKFGLAWANATAISHNLVLTFTACDVN
jgi:hypothetical protein